MPADPLDDVAEDGGVRSGRLSSSKAIPVGCEAYAPIVGAKIGAFRLLFFAMMHLPY